MQALVTGAAKRVGRAIALGLHGAGYRGAVGYRTSRAEAEASSALAVESAPEVRVDGGAPGTALPPEGMDSGPLAKRIPLGRIGTPEDAARAVLFLAQEPFVTGEILTIDGGRSLNP